MASIEPQLAAPKPERPWHQYSLRTLLLVFVVLASSLAVFGGWGIAIFALTVGLAIYVHQAESLWSLVHLVVVILCLMCLIGLLLPAVSYPREAARRTTCLNNLKQIALALHEYHRVNGNFPPAFVADANGKPMHSWRVLILPYLEYDALYKAYDFTQPWDGPKNKQLLARRPREYACPSDPNAYASGVTQTNYVAVVGANAAWASEKSRKLADVAGGERNTIMLVEVADSDVQWTEPRDLLLETLGTADGKSPPLEVSSKHARPDDFFFTYAPRSDANVAMADGRVYYLPLGSLSTDDLRKVLEIGACHEDEMDFHDPFHEVWHFNWPNIAALAVWLLSVGTLLTHAVRTRKALSVPR